VDKKFKLEIVIIGQFLSCFRPGGCVFGHGSFVVWGHHFRSTFIASTDKYIINNEEKRGEEDEQVFSGSRIRHYWFADFIILFRGFHPLQKSPPSLDHRLGVETDIYLLVSVHGKGVEGVLVIIDHYSQIAVCEFLICPLPTS